MTSLLLAVGVLGIGLMLADLVEVLLGDPLDRLQMASYIVSAIAFWIVAIAVATAVLARV